MRAERSSGSSGARSEDVLQSVWEKSLEDLDADWQKWAFKTC